MPNNKNLSNIYNQIFSEDVLDSILEKYQHDLEASGSDIMERELQDSIEPLSRGLSALQKKDLSRLEQLFRDNMLVAMRFAFSRGIYAGFDELTSMQVAFLTLVQNELLTCPNMKKYPAYRRRSDMILDICYNMEKQLEGSLREHFISFECGWDERLQGVSFQSFSLGWLYAKILYADINHKI